jgi:hypothetical protein
MPLVPNRELNETFRDDIEIASANSMVAPSSTAVAEIDPQVVERINGVPWMVEEDAAFAIGMQILQADTLDDVFAELESRSVRQMRLVGEALVLRSFALAQSAFANEPGKCPVVAYVDAVRADGSLVQFPIGNWGPTMQLVRSYEKGKLRADDPTSSIRVKIIEITSKTAGRNPALRFVLL